MKNVKYFISLMVGVFVGLLIGTAIVAVLLS